MVVVSIIVCTEMSGAPRYADLFQPT